ncbi:MAG: hypothetical protein V4665_02445 [Patescibacteria group bacterium]
MDQQELQQKIAAYYEKLPADAQALFSSMQWMETIRTISVKYNLGESQIETLGTETTLVLLGIISMNEYEDILATELALPKEIKDTILVEIHKSIFTPVRSDLENAYAINKDEQERAMRDAPLDPALSDLPENAQRAIRESDYQARLYAIGTKYKLQIERMSALEQVTLKFMAGKLSPSQYENELALSADLPAEKVRDIALDVNEEIMKNIRMSMKGQSQKETLSDEIPIPPYALKATGNGAIPTSESGMYAASGIEMLPARKEFPKEEDRVTITEDAILARSGIDMIDDVPRPDREHMIPSRETQKSVLDGIEHPATIASSIIGEKLGGIKKSESSVSDYSLPKISSQSTPSIPSSSRMPGKDPYHEPIG